jgi:hypothetical protein
MVMTMQDMLNFMLVAIGSALAAAVNYGEDKDNIQTRYKQDKDANNTQTIS